MEILHSASETELTRSERSVRLGAVGTDPTQRDAFLYVLITLNSHGSIGVNLRDGEWTKKV